MISPLYSALVQLYLEHCVLFWAQNLTRMCLEEVNKCGEKTGKHVLRGAAEDFGLVSLERRSLGSNLIALRGFQNREGREGGAGLFSWESSERMCGNVSHLHQAKFRLDIRMHYFTKKMVKCWNQLPRVVVNAPRLTVLGQGPYNML